MTATPTPPPNPDEPARRRPWFRPGTPLRLLDARVWTLADPVLRYSTVTGPGGAVPWPYLDLDPAPPDLDRYDLTVENAMKGVIAARTEGEESDMAFLLAMASAAASRLRANYDLTPAECGGLLIPGVRPVGDVTAAGESVMGVIDAVLKDFATMRRVTGRAFWSSAAVGSN